MNEAISIKKLSKRFGQFYALKEIDMRVKSGEIFGFIGPNGAGKTTTIRILLGILKATSGTATIFGKDVWTDAVQIHKRLAYVPGDISLWPNLTGGEVIDYLIRLRGCNGPNRRAELIDLFDLDPTKKCRTYSKGNRQKVALIAALAVDAELYLFDEPTSGLDPLMEKTFQDQVLRIKEEGKTVLLSSHILHEVEKLCDRVSIIKDGVIIETGSLAELRHLTRTRISVETEQEIAGLETLEGIHDIRRSNNKTDFSVDTTRTNEVLAHLTQFGVVKLASSPPTLEDLFLSHYENTRG
ncbi:MAG: ABC transporter ATP-binding protein [Actinomycetia bacterium]|nr:ABC transporter ATP-binding protein [Actinomycetes bacterium]